MTTTKLPPGWRVENLGLIEAVQFYSPGGFTLLWCDGKWSAGPSGASARGVPRASSMAEARRVGTAWINEMEASA